MPIQRHIRESSKREGAIRANGNPLEKRRQSESQTTPLRAVWLSRKRVCCLARLPEDRWQKTIK
eukprot:8835099-Heterocapsa_arctica.AAC.1